MQEASYEKLSLGYEIQLYFEFCLEIRYKMNQSRSLLLGLFLVIKPSFIFSFGTENVLIFV